jgi:hypothetical protein
VWQGGRGVLSLAARGEATARFGAGSQQRTARGGGPRHREEEEEEDVGGAGEMFWLCDLVLVVGFEVMG